MMGGCTDAQQLAFASRPDYSTRNDPGVDERF